MEREHFIQNTWNYVERLRKQSPLIHNITNYVVMNTTANILLAIGASPIMAHAREELKDLLTYASALVVNIGTLDKQWIESMKEGVQLARERKIPIVLDPVGSGASVLRTQTAKELMWQMKGGIVRGNASEILSLVEKETIEKHKGVDSLHESVQVETAAHSLLEHVEVVVISGKVDIVLTNQGAHYFENGHPLMTKVTGIGCGYTSLLGAFAGVSKGEEQLSEAALYGTAYFGVAGEIAGNTVEGPGDFEAVFKNLLYKMSQDQMKQTLQWKCKLS